MKKKQRNKIMTKKQPKEHADQLAAQMVRHFGIKAARRACRDHRWPDVLEVLKTYNQVIA